MAVAGEHYNQLIDDDVQKMAMLEQLEWIGNVGGGGSTLLLDEILGGGGSCSQRAFYAILIPQKIGLFLTVRVNIVADSRTSNIKKERKTNGTFT
ncbi:unnamed protein product [Didymodactylos carnosus]|uniref:Uncharacterized protein n=1 Tax=Didymodactylos carnosus TaxID=1234261 RepID=A0A814BUD9_9BILA|nr:unnamed protein product [Didymodactylos carnosus]CAF0949115.1 unnamed protein product [Didymodactylos carnosus]CAF3710248.1 unnamed protein product [Didymodactylos carnosus]CAF3723508.1 unnamed protein product [Didymodactylos carnosus]